MHTKSFLEALDNIRSRRIQKAIDDKAIPQHITEMTSDVDKLVFLDVDYVIHLEANGIDCDLLWTNVVDQFYKDVEWEMAVYT
jgi:hypothetical protein